MVNLVIVSHSARLGEGVGELARQMLMNDGCKLAIAAGIDDPDSPIGTDPIKVMEAIESVADTDHVLVMMDIGSALLSAETALDLLDPAMAAKVRLCAAPLVEGTLAATVSAASGAGIDKVIADAMNALEAKRVQLGLPSHTPDAAAPTLADDGDAKSVSVIINNHNGLHVRPASKLVAALAGFNADLVLEKNGKCVTPDSLNQIALLQVRRHDKLRLLARGPDADAALAAFQALAADNFGESPEAQPTAEPAIPARVEGAAMLYPLAPIQPALPAAADIAREQQRLRQAIDQTLADLNALTELAEHKFNADIAAIFAGHHTLLDDEDLFDAANDRLLTEQCSAEWAWHQVLMELSQQYRQLDDAYLQARYIDVDDILQRTLRHLQGIKETLPFASEPTIIIADNIYPSTVLQLDASKVTGLCLRDGSEQSHGAIIARAAGIAWLCQQGEALNDIQPGEAITLDMRLQRLIRR
ncbi:dihydroxyacetone kinase subunit DhaM [Salmonella enterica]|jgi:phosphoenolpyruvate---glycerone phosphotransferase subunit DhaM|uniref:phosphoenolpyruvate--glycerone phosphotransferase n=21 Tax=Enterobacteriaceae TaxID=543 RepID=A0A3W1FCR4_SALSE|nr:MULTISPECIES: dihydroxyacetone kinase phosphoryl donor subunit DhaM [Enterobacteriaceae]EAW1159632.1 dihydroxyacetone kinase subunit DhaM [Salmonella enterica subsp. enterica]EBH8708551.1 dihydroxyacetone kinase subunit DhaM [Salmonella enterica subsp. enterica serovar Newport]EBK1734111.1 dihydroxyacetone kinase subunit DhaM [Salmonella enterica subsp. enterica serovar Heidelberg]EBM7750657.1 dihydroxyacetone kinase subunit DhaM [Salmonella enterica subsp. enterica serovar Typhimurium]EDB4